MEKITIVGIILILLGVTILAYDLPQMGIVENNIGYIDVNDVEMKEKIRGLQAEISAAFFILVLGIMLLIYKQLKKL